MKGYHTHVIFEAIELIFKVITGDAPYIVLPIVIILAALGALIIWLTMKYPRKPKALILENVRTLKTHDKGKTFKTIKRVLEQELGYTVFEKVLNTADYGIPQTRIP